MLWDTQDGLTILDWEFAHIGHALIDFAILLRHFQDYPFSIESLENGYRNDGGELPNDWIQKARITDTINIIQLLNTPAERHQLFKSLIESVDFTMKKWSVLDKTNKRYLCLTVGQFVGQIWASTSLRVT